MPFNLRRSHRREFVCSGSLVDVVKSKISKVHNPDRLSHNEKPPSQASIHVRRDGGRRYIRRSKHIPPEILAYIFVVGAEQDAMLPIVVSHVCVAWRELALHTPSLWRRICIDSRLQMWAERIHRARACTLDMQLTSRSASTSSTYHRSYLDAQIVQLYMHAVAPTLARWRSLTIEFQHYAPYLWNAALSPSCGFGHTLQAPYLEELSLIYPSNDDTKEFTLFGGYAPRLRVATLYGVRLAWLPSLFGNLTFLDYSHHGFNRGNEAAAELLSMLQISDQLRDLRISFPSRNVTAPHLPTPPLPSQACVVLARLSNLELRLESPDIPSALVHLVTHLSMANLRSLRLRAPNAPHLPHSFARLRHFLRALPRLQYLQHLSLEHIWAEPQFIFALLHILPSLQHLVLRGVHATNPFLSDLIETVRARCRSPASSLPLEVLELDSCNIAADAMADALKRRLRGDSRCLGAVYLRDCVATDSAALRNVKHLGISFRVWRRGLEMDSGGWGHTPHR